MTPKQLFNAARLVAAATAVSLASMSFVIVAGAQTWVPVQILDPVEILVGLAHLPATEEPMLDLGTQAGLSDMGRPPEQGPDFVA